MFHLLRLPAMPDLSPPRDGAPPDAVMVLGSGATMISLLLALSTRLVDPVRRLISNAED